MIHPLLTIVIDVLVGKGVHTDALVHVLDQIQKHTNLNILKIEQDHVQKISINPHHIDQKEQIQRIEKDKNVQEVDEILKQLFIHRDMFLTNESTYACLTCHDSPNRVNNKF